MSFNVEQFLQHGVIIATLPGKIHIGWGEMEWSATPFESKKAFYLPDFFLSTEEPWLHPQHTQEMGIHEFQKAMGFMEHPPQISWQAPSSLFFKEQFLFIKELITIGELRKGVPIVFEHGETETGILFKRYLLSHMAQLDFPLRIYGYWDQTSGILGLTPETLFELKTPYQIKTMALAGTRPRDDKNRAPLLQDKKELNEHYIVIDEITQILERWGQVKTQPTDVLQLPYLEHLKTEIEVKLKQTHEFEEIVKELHPTPALGVAPRDAGKKWLSKINTDPDRSRFGAPFGLRNENGTGICLVAIRNVQWQDKKIKIGSGSGIVHESELNREWDEQKLKREVVKKMLGI
ncbi:MAG: chorismate-binding protein [Pseudomonadota bacterium]|nr:chorismate-binding protein [Pseudomonadota bacterium]